MTQGTQTQHLRRKSVSQPMPRSMSGTKIPSLDTQISRLARIDSMPSAMKGVVLTSMGETLATPSQADLLNLFNCLPQVGLNFTKIFDFEGGDCEGIPAREHKNDGEADSPAPSPSSRKPQEKEQKKETVELPSESSSPSFDSPGLSTTTASQVGAGPPPTRIRRPSIRTSIRPTHNRSGTLPTSASEPMFPTTILPCPAQPKPLPHPHLRPSKSSSNLVSNYASIAQVTIMPPGSVFQDHQRAGPEYDLENEENLPSPFLKKNDKPSYQAKASGAIGPLTNFTAITSGTTSTSSASRGKRRPSTGFSRRAVAAANNVERRGTIPSASTTVSSVSDNNGDREVESTTSANTGVTLDNINYDGGIPRPSFTSARKSGGEARKALLRT